ncbi:MAG: 2-C-methyl-D-erythritol 4-phosphate cytidylyltransferase [Chthoniobacteraceae bacterium]
MSSLSAIIVAAGSSRRMGFDKLFAPLHGRLVVEHSIAAFEQSPEVGEIIIVTRRDRIPVLKKVADDNGFHKVTKIIEGGAERHLSVWHGLQNVSATANFVAVHDGARPLTTPKMIDECLAQARKEGAACCAAPVPDTVKRASTDGIVSESVSREGLWAMQTPQIFSTPLLVQAYGQVIALHEPVTDEVSAVQHLGRKIALYLNNDWNFKITYPQDLVLAEQVLRLREKGSAK